MTTSDTQRDDMDLVVPAPRGPRRLCASVFIALFLLIQAVIPATYYLSANRDDERFCWRMFSTVKVHHVIHATYCTANVYQHVERSDHVVTQPVQIETMLPRVWIAALTRSQVDVIWKVFNRCCDAQSVHEVRLEVTCPKMNQFSFEPVQWAMDCDTRLIRPMNGAP